VPKIKICGLTRQSDIEAVNIGKPDYIGFVFAKSRRQINAEQARQLKQLLSPSIQAVGVFVNEPIEHIIRLCRSNIIDIIQLHGEEDNEYIKKLKEHVPNKIIKAVRVKEYKDVEKANEFASEYLLFDAYHKDQYGGTGETFDWNLISKIDKPYFLAGGIHAGNVLEALRLCNPYGIDVSSGVETNGYKDPQKIFYMIDKIRNATFQTI